MPLLRVPVLRLLRPLPLAPQGIKADMFVRDAKARCPHLTVVPYNFDAYGEALSCDEAFLDMIECLDDNMEVVTQRMRKEIFGTTKCTASACIAENKLLPCLATRSAKPNGQLFISSEKDALHRDFGKKISNMLWNYCRRIDHSVGEDFQGEASQLFIVVRTHNSIIKRSRGRGIRVPGCKESVLGCSSQTLLSTLSSHQL